MSISLFVILFFCIRDNASATTFVVPGLYITFRVNLSMKEYHVFISTFGFLSEMPIAPCQ